MLVVSVVRGRVIRRGGREGGREGERVKPAVTT